MGCWGRSHSSEYRKGFGIWAWEELSKDKAPSYKVYFYIRIVFASHFVCIYQSVSFSVVCLQSWCYRASRELGAQNTEESPSSLNWVSSVSRTKLKGEICMIPNWCPMFLFKIHHPKPGETEWNPESIKCLMGCYTGLLPDWPHHLAEGVRVQECHLPSLLFQLPGERDQQLVQSYSEGLSHERGHGLEDCQKRTSYAKLTTHPGTLGQAPSFPVVIPGLAPG